MDLIVRGNRPGKRQKPKPCLEWRLGKEGDAAKQKSVKKSVFSLNEGKASSE